MKKIFILSIFLTTLFYFTGCNKQKKNNEKTTPSKELFSLKESKNTLSFTAYKMTEKVPVKGQFKKINILSGGQGNSIKEAVDNVTFSIPVSSLFTKDTSRDFKIRKFFFGVMNQTELLSGRLVIKSDSTGYATIKMNGMASNIPFAYTIVANKFSMKATMNIDDWKADKALAALNEACRDLHKGTDGISKTWSEVALDITSEFQ